jgi:hypothetical protein
MGGGATPFPLLDLESRDAISIRTAPTKTIRFSTEGQLDEHCSGLRNSAKVWATRGSDGFLSRGSIRHLRRMREVVNLFHDRCEKGLNDGLTFFAGGKSGIAPGPRW